MIGSLRSALRLMAATTGLWSVIRLFALQLLVAVTEGAALILLVPVIQSLGGDSSLHVPGLSLHLSTPVAFGLVAFVAVLRALGQWRAAVLAVDIRLTTLDTLRLRVVEDLYVADWTYLSGQRRSHVVQRLTTDVERCQSAIAMLVRLVVGLLVLVVTTAVAVVLSPVIGSLAAIALLLVALLARSSTGAAARLGRRTSERIADFGAVVTDSLASVRVMRAHDAAAAWAELVGDEAARIRVVRRRFTASASAISAVLGVVAVLAVLGLILLGRAAGLSTPELAALAVVSTRLLASAQNLVGSTQQFVNDAPALEALQEFHEDVRRHPEPRDLPATKRESVDPAEQVPLVSLRAVQVRYAGSDRPALAGVDLDVPRTGLVLITGPSGSGKSTLLDVLLGLLRPDSGSVLVDGVPVRAMAAWRARVGYVPQQTVLVPGTVRQNLAWSLQPGASLTDEAAWQSLHVACLDDVVRALPGALDASLRELAELSGGEQQRLSIARALVRRPELLVLDEATNALDDDIEAEVLRRVLDSSRAVVLVTHRPTVAERATSQVRLEHGRLDRSKDLG